MTMAQNVTFFDNSGERWEKSSQLLISSDKYLLVCTLVWMPNMKFKYQSPCTLTKGHHEKWFVTWKEKDTLNHTNGGKMV